MRQDGTRRWSTRPTRRFVGQLSRCSQPTAESGYYCFVSTLKRAVIAVVSALGLVVACASDVESARSAERRGPEDVATNLAVPWGIAFLPDGSALIAERDSGAVKHLAAGAVNRCRCGRRRRSHAGRAVCSVSPRRAKPSSPTSRPRQDNRVVRIALRRDQAHRTSHRSSPASLPVPATTAGASRSARTASCMWRRGRPAIPPLAQDTFVAGRQDSSHQSRRFDPSRTIPTRHRRSWSFGHRNIQGLAWDSAGRLWATEYGADRVDELNLIQPGGNYGWPMAEGRSDIAWADQPGRSSGRPVTRRRPGLAYFGGSLWVACLRGQRLYQIPVGGGG